jgi:hypothetical protein
MNAEREGYDCERMSYVINLEPGPFLVHDMHADHLDDGFMKHAANLDS